MKPLLRLGFGFGVDGARLLPGHAGATQDASDAVGVDGLAERLRYPDRQRFARPGADAIDLGLWSFEDGGRQRRLLGLRQLTLPPRDASQSA